MGGGKPGGGGGLGGLGGGIGGGGEGGGGGRIGGGSGGGDGGGGEGGDGGEVGGEGGRIGGIGGMGGLGGEGGGRGAAGGRRPSACKVHRPAARTRGNGGARRRRRGRGRRGVWRRLGRRRRRLGRRGRQVRRDHDVVMRSAIAKRWLCLWVVGDVGMCDLEGVESEAADGVAAHCARAGRRRGCVKEEVGESVGVEIGEDDLLRVGKLDARVATRVAGEARIPMLGEAPLAVVGWLVGRLSERLGEASECVTRVLGHRRIPAERGDTTAAVLLVVHVVDADSLLGRADIRWIVCGLAGLLAAANLRRKGATVVVGDAVLRRPAMGGVDPRVVGVEAQVVPTAR